jgi:transposase
VLTSGVIFTDDTPVTIARPADGRGSRKGRVWCYVDREDQVAYDFTESRKRDGPLGFLAGFAGYAHADAYSGYDALFLPDDVSEVACWAHYLELRIIQSRLGRLPEQPMSKALSA